MRKAFYLFVPAVLVACSGGKDEDTPTDGPDPGDPCEEPGNICTWLGVPLTAMMSPEGEDRLDTHLYLPVDISFAPDGTAYYPDYNVHRIRMVDTAGIVNTISGTGMLGDGPNSSGSTINCWAGCDAVASAWNHPTDAVANPQAPNEVWVAAWHNSRVNVIDLDAGTMTWYAGTGGRQYADGTLDVNANGSFLDDAVMDLPSAIAFGPDGSIYFADQANHLIRRITPAGDIEIVAGQVRHAGYSGNGGPASASELHGHTDQKADPGSKIVISGNTLYLADTVNGVIRTIDLDTMTIDVFAGKYESLGTGTIVDGATGVGYEGDLGSVTGFSGDGGPATDAVMNTPRDLAVGIDGEVYIADTKNNCVRVVQDGVMDTFAGTCGTYGFDGDEGPAAEAVLSEVFGVATDPEGNVYIADTNNHVIRRVKR